MRELVKVWKEPEALQGKRIQALVAIITTRGCSWFRRGGGCTMCGYNIPRGDAEINGEVLKGELERVASAFGGEELIKIYTSGSFLDPGEVPQEAVEHFVESLGRRAEELGVRPHLLVESRPEYVTEEALEPLISNFSVTVAQGLETSSDVIREESIRKGFRTVDFLRALEVLKRTGAGSKVYLLLKPLFLTEREAIEDVVGSFEFLKDLYVQTISVNPVNVQKGTLVERLYREGKYRPPWLWSLIYVLKVGKAIAGDRRVMSEPSGGGRPRGPHNCFRCDRRVLRAIRDFSYSPDNSLRRLEVDRCVCIRSWRFQTAFSFA